MISEKTIYEECDVLEIALGYGRVTELYEEFQRNRENSEMRRRLASDYRFEIGLLRLKIPQKIRKNLPLFDKLEAICETY